MPSLLVRGRIEAYIASDADVRSPGTSETHLVCEVRGGTNLLISSPGGPFKLSLFWSPVR